jgi:hypothetical protein
LNGLNYQLGNFEKANPIIGWQDAFLTEPASDQIGFLPEVNVQSFFDNIRREINPEV